MKLHTLPKIKAATHRKKRLGSGKGSGLGKTSGRGQKGSGARSGYSTHLGFEGGQMPLYRKLPHRGFNNKIFTKNYEIINVGDLDRLKLKEVDQNVLVEVGVIGKSKNPLKVLGHGELASSITVTAEKFSSSAISKIEAAGGKVIVIEKKEPVEDTSAEEKEQAK